MLASSSTAACYRLPQIQMYKRKAVLVLVCATTKPALYLRCRYGTALNRQTY
jgi:hypothetical protein